MKEFEFKDIKGLEDKNTPNQLDTFEVSSALGLKDRYIFDFSKSMTTFSWLVSDPSTAGYDYNHFWYWYNYSYFNDSYGTANGMAGNACLIQKNFRAITTSPTNTPPIPAPIFSKIPSINLIDNYGNEELVPYFEENLAIYLDAGTPDALGLGQYPNQVKYFRSGYIELTLKTNKPNCIIAFGSGSKSSINAGLRIPGITDEVSFRESPSSIDNKIAYTNEVYSELNELGLYLENGKLKLTYEDKYGNNKQNFTLLGNKNIADNQWHHIVINIGKPGIIRQHGKKYNQKFIEFWIDGDLDYKTTNYINNEQIFFPLIEWLGINPIDAFSINKNDAWKNYDQDGDSYIDFNNPTFLYEKALSGTFNDNALVQAFNGAIHTFISGINTALSRYEIKQRNRLYRGYEKNEVEIFNITAELKMPTISSNKPKALKLFWNNLIDENGKHGLELDDTYDIYSYSVTHKIFNSSSEVNNIDLCNIKELKALADVKVALTDNVILWNPSAILLDNDALKYGNLGKSAQWNMHDNSLLNTFNVDTKGNEFYTSNFRQSSFIDLKFSGIELNSGDRILLTNQYNKKDNGIWIFNGNTELLTRANDAKSANDLNNGLVRVTDGYYKDTTWLLSNNISSLNDPQEWIELEYHPNSLNINSQPIYLSRWQENNKEERFIDLQQDLNINDFDFIVFMNYPENNEQIKNNFIGYDDFEIIKKYNNFIQSLKTVVANGANLYISSPKLAEDLKIVKRFTEVPQLLQSSDAAASSISPFELNEPAERYFDTHRINKYKLVTSVPGLTDKETYLLTDFINFTPETGYDYDQYHAKYSYRQFGLQEGNEFIIPGTALRKITEKDDLPGYRQNQLGTKSLFAVAPFDILAGTSITRLVNNYYNNDVLTPNLYSDYATTIIVHNGQILDGTPINGKIFVNCVEDGYTFSRKEYNKSYIQILPQVDINETVSTREWQYSTSRLNRKPQRINVSGLTINGQTTPTNGGGGPFIQAPSNSSNGIVRSKTDRNNIDYQSDLYPTEEEEIYPLQEIPVLSMTWLGLQWLAG